MTTLKELMVRLGAIRVVEPVIDVAYARAEERAWRLQLGDSPHGRPWFTSFHASAFPGDDPQACGRLAMYQMMDVPMSGPADRFLATTADVGKALELAQVRRARDAGFLVRANNGHHSTDPDTRLPQIGFVDHRHWLTGSIDMPILPFNYDAPHIVEIKSKSATKLDEMRAGVRGPDESHRRQLLCSLGLAHENPQMFVHPTEDRPLEPARDGSIYYIARDTEWPGPIKTFEFFFEYSPGFMEEGRATLALWRGYFLEDHLPTKAPRKNARSHPNGPGWAWSQGKCRFCSQKRACRADYDNNVSQLSKSHAVAVASFSRPGYNPVEKRNLVLDTWKVNGNVQQT